MLGFEEKGILEYEGERGRKNGKCKQFVNKRREIAFFGQKRHYSIERALYNFKER